MSINLLEVKIVKANMLIRKNEVSFSKAFSKMWWLAVDDKPKKKIVEIYAK